MTDYAVYCGLDVGKQAYHACALDSDGRRVFDAELPQDEQLLAGLLADLEQHGPVLVVVDQPNTIGALPFAVARALGIDVASGQTDGAVFAREPSFVPRAMTSAGRGRSGQRGAGNGRLPRYLWNKLVHECWGLT